MRYLILSLALMVSACSGYKTPTVSNPSKMSEDTLCYRYAYAKKDAAVRDEVRARNLDCEENLRQQAPLGDSRY